MSEELQQHDNWEELKAFTEARIALGRVGVSIPLKESLAFKLAHAHARDAVFSSLAIEKMQEELKALNLKSTIVQSKATTRAVYLQRPDWGRMLDENSWEKLEKTMLAHVDIAIVISDGLSATAVNHNAIPLLEQLIPLLKKENYSIAPVTLATQARVAIGDAIGHLLSAKMVINLIGERPGLSASDSMGAYLTYHPEIGLTDERRNCISNIRPKGLSLAAAAQKIVYLIREAFILKCTGIALKDNNENQNTLS